MTIPEHLRLNPKYCRQMWAKVSDETLNATAADYEQADDVVLQAVAVAARNEIARRAANSHPTPEVRP